jgi:hypothetical protein
MENVKECVACQGGWKWDATISMYQRCSRCFGYGYIEKRRKTKLA